ncbi:DnaB-like helicase N-terminal domain-containing protein [Prescottella equi]|uniref:DnaB-like helicase N-terminal domain-containing protein n=1 Tax=Rhodococcus hoagii TaxID=43767 RepID=UPI001EEC8BD6|nr:DnaB-like helicase N-terminal domain-containing protein [Prescottella equi]
MQHVEHDETNAFVDEPTDDPGSEYTEPELDPEAHMLCAAMWTRDDTTLRFVVERMTEADFANPFHRPVFAAIRDAVLAGHPHDPASVSMALGRAGSQAVPAAVHNHFRAALTLGSSAGALRYYAADVVAVAYRRSFHELAATMAHAAAEAAEDQLFPILVDLGTRQRSEMNRLRSLRDDPLPTTATDQA